MPVFSSVKICERGISEADQCFCLWRQISTWIKWTDGRSYSLYSFKGLNQIEGKIYLLYMIIIFCLLNPLTCRKKRGFEPIHFFRAAGEAPVPSGELSLHTDRVLRREGRLCCTTSSCVSLGMEGCRCTKAQAPSLAGNESTGRQQPQWALFLLQSKLLLCQIIGWILLELS